MRDGKHKHFPDNNTFIIRVKKWVSSNGADVTWRLLFIVGKKMRSQWSYEEKYFVAENLIYPRVLLCSLYLL